MHRRCLQLRRRLRRVADASGSSLLPVTAVVHDKAVNGAVDRFRLQAITPKKKKPDREIGLFNAQNPGENRLHRFQARCVDLLHTAHSLGGRGGLFGIRSTIDNAGQKYDAVNGIDSDLQAADIRGDRQF